VHGPDAFVVNMKGRSSVSSLSSPSLTTEHSTGLRIDHDFVHLDLTLAVLFLPPEALPRRGRDQRRKPLASHRQGLLELTGSQRACPSCDLWVFHI
jgi:hypothetical protein